MKRLFCLTIALIMFLGGCASGPVLYPNAYLKTVGQEQADRDIADCRQQAEAYVKSDAAKTVAKDTVIKASEPSPLYKSFVNRCLSTKGYEVIGWGD